MNDLDTSFTLVGNCDILEISKSAQRTFGRQMKRAHRFAVKAQEYDEDERQYKRYFTKMDRAIMTAHAGLARHLLKECTGISDPTNSSEGFVRTLYFYATCARTSSRKYRKQVSDVVLNEL